MSAVLLHLASEMGNALAIDNTLSEHSRSEISVGVLSFHNSKETKAILNAVAALGHTAVWLREENTRVWMNGGELHFEPAVDVVVNRLLATKAVKPLDDLGVAASYLAERPVLNRPGAVIRAMHKFRAATELSAAGIPVPDAYMAFSQRAMDDGEHPISGRAVHKPAVGTNGNRMSLIDEGAPASPQIARRRAFLQEFLDQDSKPPFDIRVCVVDGVVIGAMKRFAPPDEWRTNVALGGDVEDVSDSIDTEALDYAKRATEVIGLDYAGVDLLSRNEDWYILEVNPTAGFKGFFEATGRSPAPAIAKLAIERAEGSVDDTMIADLSSSLDDSTPECRPDPDRPVGNRETVGYTERVTLAGHRGIKHATAKVDTGAKRTSIDLDAAAEIGAGSIVGTTRVKSGLGTTGNKRPLIDVELKVGSRWHATTASLEVRSHVRYPVLIGRDVLGGYRVDIQQRVDEE